ncbi:MAG: hypothetical protein WB679_25875 [Terracidiphilus sp.]
MSNLDSLVEATVTRLSFDRERAELRFEVSCVFGDRGRKVIVASGIEDLLVDDVRTYNIIDRVTIFTAADAAQEINDCTKSLFYLMQKRELSTSDLEWPAFKEKLARIQSGEFHLMEIEPVAGASAVVLARLIAIESLPIQDAEEKGEANHASPLQPAS